MSAHPTTESALPGTPATPGGWIVSPAFDLLFLANLGWLLALAPGFVAADGTTHIEFWQIYFITTPHRWITLFLVAADPDRRGSRAWPFVVIALLALIAVGGVWLSTGAFVCLLLVDYLWNGWHFASQHFGVLRMYARKAGGSRYPWLERHGLRLFIFYTSARTAAWSTRWVEDYPTGMKWLSGLDWLMLGLAVLLLMSEALHRPAGRVPKLIYLASVCGLYSGLLLALHYEHTTLVLALTVASATFHAVEYLAIVTHYAWRRQTHGSAGVFQAMARRWLSFLAVYLVLLGLCGVLAERGVRTWWLGLNLWAALLHYAYDGMIWKLRRPETAQALGVEIPGSPSARTKSVPSASVIVAVTGPPVVANIP
jgi:hypothetical protein